jgi:hypothetical protein
MCAIAGIPGRLRTPIPGCGSGTPLARGIHAISALTDRRKAGRCFGVESALPRHDAFSGVRSGALGTGQPGRCRTITVPVGESSKVFSAPLCRRRPRALAEQLRRMRPCRHRRRRAWALKSPRSKRRRDGSAYTGVDARWGPRRAPARTLGCARSRPRGLPVTPLPIAYRSAHRRSS